MASPLVELPSHRLLGALRDAFLLPLPDDAAARKRLQRYLSGAERPSETKITALVHDMCRQLCQVRGVGVALPPEAAPELADRVLFLLGVADYKTFDVPGAIERFLDHLATSFGFHVAGYCLLHQEPAPWPVPNWLSGDPDSFIHSLLIDEPRRTRKQLFESLEKRHPTKRVLESWLAGGRPRSDEALVKLARLAACGGDHTRLYGRLRMHYAMRAFHDALADRCGPAVLRAFVDKVCAVSFYVHRITTWLMQRGDLGDADSTHKALVTLMFSGPAAIAPRAQAIPWLMFTAASSHIPDADMNLGIREALDDAFLPQMRLEDARGADLIGRELGDAKTGAVDLQLLVGLNAVMERRHAKEPSAARTDLAVRLQQVNALVARGALDEALIELENVRPIADAKAQFHMLHALVLERAGHPQKARTAAARAAALGHPFVRAVLEQAPELVREMAGPRTLSDQ